MLGLSTEAGTVLRIYGWSAQRSTVQLQKVLRWYKLGRLAGVPVVVLPFSPTNQLENRQGGISTSIMVEANPYICGGIAPSSSTCWGPTGWKLLCLKSPWSASFQEMENQMTRWPTHPSGKIKAETCWTTLVRTLSTVWGKGSFSLQHWWGLIWSIMSSSGLLSTKVIWFTGVSPVEWGLK